LEAVFYHDAVNVDNNLCSSFSVRPIVSLERSIPSSGSVSTVSLQSHSRSLCVKDEVNKSISPSFLNFPQWLLKSITLLLQLLQ